MLTLEDRELLGLRADKAPRRPSAVSQILKAVKEDVEHATPAWTLESPYEIAVANDQSSRERAYRLAHRVYRGCGYVSEAEGWIVNRWDASPQAFTLLALDAKGGEAATVSLVFDSPQGLPCDEVFGPELALPRAQGCRLVEVTRLAIAEEHMGSKALLVSLFNLCFIFGRRIRCFDRSVIEVNPRHVNYYQRLLAYEPVGEERPCPRVRGAPARLMSLDLRVYDREVARVSQRAEAPCKRSLYPYFFPWLEEGAAAAYLARQYRPMDEAEARHFGLRNEPAYREWESVAASD